MNDLYYHPFLIKYLRENAYKVKSVNRVIYEINILTNEFPHLYDIMLEK